MFTEDKIKEMMQHAQNIQKKMEEIQKKISITEVIGKSGAGLVTIIMNGNYICKNITINNELLDKKNKTILQDLIISAINDAVKKITELQQKKLSMK